MSCRVLITGVSGFVGGALGVYLRSLGGYHVTGVSRGAARAGSVDAFFSWDLTRPLPSDLGRFDAVVHAAALSAPWGAAGGVSGGECGGDCECFGVCEGV